MLRILLMVAVMTGIPLSVFSSDCPTGYSLVSGRCYKVFKDDSMSWADAEATCKADSGHLASVLSKDDHWLIEDLIHETISDQEIIGRFWIGLQVMQDKSLKWVDGETVDFTNWNTNEPNEELSSACVLLNRNSDWTWIVAQCSEENHFVCKIAEGGPETTVPAAEETSEGKTTTQTTTEKTKSGAARQQAHLNYIWFITLGVLIDWLSGGLKNYLT